MYTYMFECPKDKDGLEEGEREMEDKESYHRMGHSLTSCYNSGMMRGIEIFVSVGGIVG